MFWMNPSGLLRRFRKCAHTDSFLLSVAMINAQNIFEPRLSWKHDNNMSKTPPKMKIIPIFNPIPFIPYWINTNKNPTQTWTHLSEFIFIRQGEWIWVKAFANWVVWTSIVFQLKEVLHKLSFLDFGKYFPNYPFLALGSTSQSRFASRIITSLNLWK